MFEPSPSEHAKWKLRLLAESGVESRRDIGLPELPDGEHAHALAVWRGLDLLIAVEQLCGCRGPVEPVMLCPSFCGRRRGEGGAWSPSHAAKIRAAWSALNTTTTPSR